MSLSTEAAYRECRAIAKAAARNFYYAFAALPETKRNAICAVYAFMRRADDLSDDEGRSPEERRRALQEWLQGWHETLRTGHSGNPVLLALLDAQHRFSIAPALLDQLVEGTATDLRPAPQEEPDATEESSAAVHRKSRSLAGFATFEDLYRYCYLVASVVGLVSIRIFGYADPRAEKLAEETGIAFQLTNILRDVREDAERGRVYLPQEDLDHYGVQAEEFASLALTPQRPLTAGQKEVLALQAKRAEAYYRSAALLEPLICPDSRPALWVLVSIYRRLLRRIVDCDFNVFRSRISVPAYEKLAWMSAGLGKVLVARISHPNRQFEPAGHHAE